MREYPLDFVQLTYNILDREPEKRLLPLARDRGIVAILLLHADGPSRVRKEISNRDQTGDAGHSQGGRFVRDRAGARCATARRWRLYGAIRLRAADSQRATLRQMAGVR